MKGFESQRLDGAVAARFLLERTHQSSLRHQGTAHPPGVMMVTTFDSDDLVLGALEAGALGFVFKDTPPARIVDAVRTVAEGNPVLSPAATARVIAAATGPRSSTSRRGNRETARQTVHFDRT